MFQYLVWLRETDSTQERLKEGNYPCGTVLVADIQKKGKGRKGRRWESREGGLYFSFVICEEDFRDVSQLPLIVGLGVSEFLEDLGIGTALKWPNDVYVKGKKIAGILAERIKERVVVGVGLNVNQREFPDEVAGRAISMFQATGKEWNRLSILLKLLDRIAYSLDLYSREGFGSFRERIEEKLLFKGEEVVILSEKPEVGIMLGIDDRGYLLLQTSEGIKSIAAGDVSLRLWR